MGQGQPPRYALLILVAGVTFQGLGMLTATFIYCPYLARLMAFSLPNPSTRPGMFMPSFTGLTLLRISGNLSMICPSYTTISSISNSSIISDIFRIVAVSIAVILVLLRRTRECGIRREIETRHEFHLVWWPFIFPNAGFTRTTINIGNAFMNEGILWLGSAVTIADVTALPFVGTAHGRAVWKK